MNVSARYEAAIKKHIDSPVMHGFETTYSDGGKKYAAAASVDGTYFYMRSEGTPPQQQYFCRYGNATEPVAKPSLADIKKLETALPLPFESIWGVVDKKRVVELYWFDNHVALRERPGAPEVLNVICKERAGKSLGPLLWKGQSSMDLSAFWSLVAKKRLVPVAKILHSQGVLKSGVLELPNGNAAAIITRRDLFLHPQTWLQVPNATPAMIGNVTLLPPVG